VRRRGSLGGQGRWGEVLGGKNGFGLGLGGLGMAILRKLSLVVDALICHEVIIEMMLYFEHVRGNVYLGQKFGWKVASG
jgi:hypothetical protein